MEGYVIQIVCPEIQCVGPDRAAIKVVTCVLDADAHVVLRRIL
jgi:hypothetical protein